MTDLDPGHGYKAIAIFNQKGGVGKTATAMNFGVILAASGKKVCIIDLDAQGNATSSLSGPAQPLKGAYEFLSGAASWDEAVIRTPFPNYTLLPATKALAGMEMEFASLDNPQFILRNRLAEAMPPVDYIVIDCPPALGMLPVNALVSAQYVVIPVQCEPFAHDGLKNAAYSIRKIQSNLNTGLSVQGFLMTMISKDAITWKLAEIIRREFGLRVYATEIPRDPCVAEAAARDVPVAVFDPTSKASESYVDFTAEFLVRERTLAGLGGEPSDTPRAIRRFHESVVTTLDAWRQAFHKGTAPSFVEQSLDLDLTKGAIAPDIEPWPDLTAQNKPEAPVITGPGKQALGAIILLAVGFLAGLAIVRLGIL